MLTPEKIDELRRLLAKATPGPWKNHLVDDTTIVASNGFEIGTTWPGGSVYNGFVDPAEQHEINAALIVAMRNALPALLDRLEKAEGELAEAREDVRSLCRFILNEWGPDGALKATTFALEQRQSAKGGDANAAPDRDTNSKSATSPGVTAGASAGWQSIETAPRDGTRFLTWDSYYGVRMGRAFMRADHDDWLSYVDSNGSSHKGGIRASHWMPLPAAPVDGGEDA